MKLSQIKNQYQQVLSELYSKNEIEKLFYRISEFVLDKEKILLKLSLDEENESIKTKSVVFAYYLNELAQGKPIQYLTGEEFFYGHKFFVSQDVLIPRPETEELVNLIIKENNSNLPLKILDIGTGSGCIAISLKKENPLWEITALDICEKALEIAKKNSNVLNTEIEWKEYDILLEKETKKLDIYDIIVSNPPYIPKKEKILLHKNVLDYDPHQALFVENNQPLIFYEKIISFARRHLTPNGIIYVEINQYLAEETKKLFNFSFKQVELKKDYSDNYRMIKAHLLK